MLAELREDNEDLVGRLRDGATSTRTWPPAGLVELDQEQADQLIIVLFEATQQPQISP